MSDWEELVGVAWRVSDCEELVGVNHTTESVTDLAKRISYCILWFYLFPIHKLYYDVSVFISVSNVPSVKKLGITFKLKIKNSDIH